MRVGLINMDPVIAKAIADRLCGPREKFLSEDIIWAKPGRRSLFDDDDDEDEIKRKRKPSSDEKYALYLRKRRDDLVARRTILYVTPTALVAGLMAYAGWNFSLNHPQVSMALFSGAIVGGAIAAFLGNRWANMGSQIRALQYEVILEELNAALPYLSLTRAERVYCDNLVMLSNFEANLEARREIRRTLPQLNSMLADSRKLEKQRKALLPALGSSPVKELAVEKERLEARIKEATDEVTRRSLEQSLESVKARMENSSSLEQALQRINAQQEAIVNALALTQGALARMQVGPSVQLETAAQEIAATVADINQRTISVELAVQEIMAGR